MVWNFSRYSQKVAALSDLGQSITYEELEQFGIEFYSKIKKRCLIFSFCRNTIGSLAGYTACIEHNIVPLLLDDKIENELLQHLILLYQPDYLWIPMEQKSQFREQTTVWEKYGYVLLQTNNSEVYPLYSELALLLPTSGSTGSPKLVKQTRKNIVSNLNSIVQYLELGEGERPITTLPMNYTYGLSIINSHLAVGATMLLTEHSLIERDFWDFLKKERATSFGGVPYTYEILDKIRFCEMELPYLTCITEAGGRLSKELHKKFAAYALQQGKRFYVMYGQTEATARMSYLPFEKSLEKSGSIGIAIPGGKFSLIEESGEEIKDCFVTGELVYYGENVTLGYAQCGEDLANKDERHGVLKTGDMAQRDSDGYYYIVGRKKRFLKLYGNRINLDEVESMLQREYHSFECVCSGEDENLIVFIVLEKEKQIEANKIKRFLATKMNIHPSAFTVQFVDSIPRTTAGKPLYHQLMDNKIT